MTLHLVRRTASAVWIAGLVTGLLPAMATAAPPDDGRLPESPRVPSFRAATSGGQAQALADGGRLVLAARDALDGLLPGATVTLVGPGEGVGEPRVVVTDASGQAIVEALAPGRYTVEVEMSGFEPQVLEVDVARGQSVRRIVRLALGGFTEHVAVVQDEAQRQATDGFAETLSAEEIDQLPDDAEELAQLLEELAGGEAEFRVNGFEGGELPPRAQIQAIRIRQDPFSPDSHGAGRPRVEIITRPGSAAWTHEVSAGLRDQSLDARHAFAPERGEGQTRRASWSVSGPLIRDRMSFSARVFTSSLFDAQTIVARSPAGDVNDVVSQERGRFDAEVRVETALTDTHTLGLEYQRRNYTGGNLGVGGFDLRERAYANDRERHVFRISGTGTVGTKVFNEFRVEYADDIQSTDSFSGERTIDVQNAFTAGGAQRQGGLREREVEVGNDLEIVAGDRHKIRLGFEGEFGRSTSDRRDNFAGTFTFASLDDYEAGRPLQFVQRSGDPGLEYSRYEFSWWVHDERRLGDGLQIGMGLRHDFQGFLEDRSNFAPRVSVAWKPVADGRTTVRAGVGVFNDWYSAGIYEQTLRLDGERQRDLIVRNPGFPDPFGEGAEVELPPPSVIRAADDLALQSTRRVSLGVEHRTTEQVRFRLNVFGQFTRDRLRSLNVNAPFGGMRPDPAFGRITEIRSTGRAEARGVDASVRVGGRRGGGPSGMLRYRYAHDWNDADGALNLPADSTNLAAEWGPASGDVRHRLFGSLQAPLPFGIRASLWASMRSGAPYTIRTGFDDNGDTVPNDRPAGVGRNTARGTWHRNVDLRLGWRPWTIDGSGSAEGGRQSARRGLEVFARGSNLFNETNYTRFTGVLTSPFFGLPTGASAPRRFDVGVRVSF